MRLPSFNDFSPKILKHDIRTALSVVSRLSGNDSAIHAEFADRFFGGAQNKRSSINIPATLRATGLAKPGKPLQLTHHGEQVLAAADSTKAAQLFCAEIIRNLNGMKLIEAIRSLAKRRDDVTKESLKRMLQSYGVVGLSTNTTDHTTLKNWMIEAGILSEKDLRIDEGLLKALVGISSAEHDEFSGLSEAQQIFLRTLRTRHATGSGPFSAGELRNECAQAFPHLFSDSQFAAEIRNPLRDSGWLTVEGLAAGKQGGKSGRVSASTKLLDIPLDQLRPGFDAGIPPDLRGKLDLPLEEVRADLFGANKHKAGIALEVLALKMIADLSLTPRGFRVRSRDTAYAEVDLTAEGEHLLFSRWAFQCKRTDARVGLGDVAKEVGIAVFTKAHVVAIVTTSDFSREAEKYAQEVTKATHLQFLFVPGRVVREYLSKGRGALVSYAMNNSHQVMLAKKVQPLAPAD